MCAVAIGWGLGVLALAKIGGLFFLGGEDQGFEFGGFMRTVTEGLILGKATSAPGVFFPGFQLNCLRLFRGDSWLGHVFPL